MKKRKELNTRTLQITALCISCFSLGFSIAVLVCKLKGL